MPYLVDVTEARVWAKEMERENQTADIALELDAAMEQENLEDCEEGVKEHPELDHLDPEQYDINSNDPKEKNMNPVIYGRIDVPNEEELREKTRQLDENQRRVVDTVVRYCRSVVKAQEWKQPAHTRPHDGARSTWNRKINSNQTVRPMGSKDLANSRNRSRKAICSQNIVYGNSSSQYRRSNTNKHILNAVWKSVHRTWRQEHRD